MRSAASVLLSAVLLAVLVGGVLAVLAVVEASDTVPGQATPPAESSCVAAYAKSVRPGTVLLGETVTVTMRTTILCAGAPPQFRMALVIGSSTAITGGNMSAIQEAAVRFVENLNLARNSGIEIGVVEYNDSARTVVELSNSESQVVDAIRATRGGGAEVQLGVTEAERVVIAGRPGSQLPDATKEVVIVFADGHADAGCSPLLRAADLAKAKGILLATICIGAGCDAQCLRQAASSPRFFYQAENAAQLYQVLRQFRLGIIELEVAELVITDSLRDNMKYVDGSAMPDPVVGAGGSTLQWTTNQVPKDGITITYGVEPLEPGYWPVSIKAAGVFTDTRGLQGSFEFAVPYVSIDEPEPHPSPQVTAEPSATPMPDHGYAARAYLPFALDGE